MNRSYLLPKPPKGWQHAGPSCFETPCTKIEQIWHHSQRRECEHLGCRLVASHAASITRWQSTLMIGLPRDHEQSRCRRRDHLDNATEAGQSLQVEPLPFCCSRRVEEGSEEWHTAVLKLLKRGCRTMQNVRRKFCQLFVQGKGHLHLTANRPSSQVTCRV